MIILKLDKITKTYGSGQTIVKAIDNIDLEIKKGEIVLIMGPSGSGKTTLLSIAGGILRPTKGRVKIKDINITALDEHKLPKIRRENIGFIFQSFNLLSSLSAQENVELATNLTDIKSSEGQERARTMLKNLGLGNRLNAIPAQLSGGEKQRVAIARALINNPEIILADEPTANLDSKIGHEAAAILKDIAKKRNKSVLIVSHDTRIRDIADRILWLEDGKFKKIGKVAIDPVCEMAVEKTDVFVRSKGKTYYFCSQGCKKEFLRKKPTN